MTLQNGNTALLFAISGSQPRCTELLLQHGADLMARNTRGHSPAELAIRMADKEGMLLYMGAVLMGGVVLMRELC